MPVLVRAVASNDAAIRDRAIFACNTVLEADPAGSVISVPPWPSLERVKLAVE
jgi:hypothetical protein